MQETQEIQTQSLGRKDPLEEKWLAPPVFLPGGAWRATVHGVTQSQIWLNIWVHTRNRHYSESDEVIQRNSDQGWWTGCDKVWNWIKEESVHELEGYSTVRPGESKLPSALWAGTPCLPPSPQPRPPSWNGYSRKSQGTDGACHKKQGPEGKQSRALKNTWGTTDREGAGCYRLLSQVCWLLLRRYPVLPLSRCNQARELGWVLAANGEETLGWMAIFRQCFCGWIWAPLSAHLRLLHFNGHWLPPLPLGVPT